MLTHLSQVVQQMGKIELPQELTAPGLELASLIDGDAYVAKFSPSGMCARHHRPRAGHSTYKTSRADRSGAQGPIPSFH
jgi:hypothetical protein